MSAPLDEVLTATVLDEPDEPESPGHHAAEGEALPAHISAPPAPVPLALAAEQETTDDQVQWTLLEMGASLGLDVWVARNDRNRSFAGHAFLDAPRLREVLPRQFEPRSCP